MSQPSPDAFLILGLFNKSKKVLLSRKGLCEDSSRATTTEEGEDGREKQVGEKPRSYVGRPLVERVSVSLARISRELTGVCRSRPSTSVSFFFFLLSSYHCFRFVLGIGKRSARSSIRRRDIDDFREICGPEKKSSCLLRRFVIFFYFSRKSLKETRRRYDDVEKMSGNLYFMNH